MPTTNQEGAELKAGERELPTSEVAKLLGVKPYLLRKWKMRGDLKLAPRAYAGAGRGNEAMWSAAAIAEARARAMEHRNGGFRNTRTGADSRE